jgi:perosamine synthetase
VEIADLCREHGLFLIEDCAHALYSTHLGRPLGAFGDAAVFSLWKTLPMPHGAAVLANVPLDVAGGTVAPPLSTSLTPLRSSLEGHAFLRYGRAGWAAASLSSHLAQLVSRGPDSGPNSHITFDQSTANWSISPTSRRIAYRSPHAQIAPQRRENYAFLAEQLADLEAARPLYATLPNSTCPLWLPLVVDEPESLVRELARNRIGAEVFWCEFHPAFPAAEFPESTYLKTHVVALPIHQDLDAHLLQHVAAVVRAWARPR